MTRGAMPMRTQDSTSQLYKITRSPSILGDRLRSANPICFKVLYLLQTLPINNYLSQMYSQKSSLVTRCCLLFNHLMVDNKRSNNPARSTNEGGQEQVESEYGGHCC